MVGRAGFEPATSGLKVAKRMSAVDPKRTYDFVSGLEREGYRPVRTRISTNARTATAYFSMVGNVGRAMRDFCLELESAPARRS
jgi:hypothetical protein